MNNPMNYSTYTVPIIVRYRSSFSEMYRALSAIDRAIPRVQRIRLFAKCAFLLSIAVFVTMVVAENPPSWLNIVFGFSVLFSMIVFILRWVSPAHVAWLTRRQSKIWAGERVFAFSQDGIENTGVGVQSFVRWESVIRVAETSKFLLFFTSDQCGFYIPKRVFSSTDECERLTTMLRERAGQSSLTDVNRSVSPTFKGSSRLSLTFEFTTAERSRAMTAITRHSGILRMWYVFIVVLGLWSMGPRLYRIAQESTYTITELMTLIPTMLLLMFLIGLIPLASWFQARRIQRTSRTHQGLQSIDLYDEGIATHGSLYNSQFAWTVFVRVVETTEFFLFFVGKAEALFIPKRVIVGDGIDIIRTSITNNLGDRATVFSTDAVGATNL